MTTPFDAWANIYDAVHSHRTADVRFYVESAQATGGTVLELGCGTGRIAIPIARARVDVVGLDSSPGMLREARRNLKEAGPLPGTIAFRRGDMRRFRLPQAFTLAIIPFNSFLHLLSVADQRHALECIRHHLAPGGLLALDIFVPDLHRLAREEAQLYAQGHVTDTASGRRFALWEQGSYDHLHQVIQVRTIIEELDATGTVVQRLYRDHQTRYVHRYEMQHLLELSGFQVEALYGDFDGGDFDAESETMVWVARSG